MGLNFRNSRRIFNGLAWIRKWGECGSGKNLGGLPFLPRYQGKTAERKSLLSNFA